MQVDVELLKQPAWLFETFVGNFCSLGGHKVDVLFYYFQEVRNVLFMRSVLTESLQNDLSGQNHLWERNVC